MEDWLRESFVSPIFEDSYSTDCHVCNTSTNITGTQTPCPVHNFDIGWCPDGCEPAPEPDALPDFNNFPCEHNVGVRDGEVVMESIVVAAYKFELVEDKAVCADFQVAHAAACFCCFSGVAGATNLRKAGSERAAILIFVMFN